MDWEDWLFALVVVFVLGGYLSSTPHPMRSTPA